MYEFLKKYMEFRPKYYCDGDYLGNVRLRKMSKQYVKSKQYKSNFLQLILYQNEWMRLFLPIIIFVLIGIIMFKVQYIPLPENYNLRILLMILPCIYPFGGEIIYSFLNIFVILLQYSTHIDATYANCNDIFFIVRKKNSGSSDEMTRIYTDLYAEISYIYDGEEINTCIKVDKNISLGKMEILVNKSNKYYPIQYKEEKNMLLELTKQYITSILLIFLMCFTFSTILTSNFYNHNS